MKKLFLKQECALRALRLARCQQASENGTLGDDQIRLLANREVNLIINISFTKTNDYDD